MKVRDMICNHEFTFNLEIRIMKYDFDTDESTVLYEDLRDKGIIPEDIMDSWISAVNMGDDGVVEIEIY